MFKKKWVLAGMYLALWFCCGCYYWVIENFSPDKEFIFAPEVRLEQRIKAFKSSMSTSMQNWFCGTFGEIGTSSF